MIDKVFSSIENEIPMKTESPMQAEDYVTLQDENDNL